MSETTKIEYRARVWEGIDTFDAVAASTAGGSMRDDFPLRAKTPSRRSTTTASALCGQQTE